MSVLVFAENWDGKFKKSTYEAVSYASEVAKQTGTDVCAVVLGKVADDEIKNLGKYGAAKVLRANDESLNKVNPAAYTQLIAEAAQKAGASVVVISQTYTGKSIAARVAIRLKAGFVSGAVKLPSGTNPLTIRKKCFSGKGLTDVVINAQNKVIGLTPNAYQLVPNEAAAAVEDFTTSVNAGNYAAVETKKTSGKIALTEAEIVVSAGRGLKGPENWGMIEQLAELLGAATACSKPVADIGWRPHHEHVGQTGITIGPNLYFAIGISGAIQHLAGVSSSKVIVAINSDPEAPFFKAADYGIVGDAFDIVPKLIEAVKQFKASHH